MNKIDNKNEMKDFINDPFKYQNNDGREDSMDFRKDAEEGLAKISKEQYLQSVDHLNVELQKMIHKKKNKNLSPKRLSPVNMNNWIIIVVVVLLLLIAIFSIFKIM